MNKRTKIVATLGPASDSVGVLRKMVQAGLDVARLNFSHNTHESHRLLVERLRRVAKETHTTVGIMQDLQGPKVRVGELAKSIKVEPGDLLLLYWEQEERLTEGQNGKKILKKFQAKYFLPVQFPVTKFAKKGKTILINDGVIELKTLLVSGHFVLAQADTFGLIETHKGMNFPGAHVNLPSLTEKDLEDLKFGLGLGIDFVALSFVKSHRDVIKLKKQIAAWSKDRPQPWVIAKIEKQEAVKDFDKILRVTDGIMIARGDLGLEMPQESVPIIQKDLVARCLRAGKPVIVATQMLESMAYGAYPVKVIETMRKVIEETEESPFNDLPDDFFADERSSKAAAVANAAHELAKDTKAKAIVAASFSGFTGRMIARHRPENAQIIVVTNQADVQTKLSLVWGTHSFFTATAKTFEELVKHMLELVKKQKIAKKGERVVMVTGEPLGQKENLNLVEVKTV
ncbi:MAG: pyruvate kinase [Candidatus Komeilibacteria bacterium]|nr:pyruvate kinase [Candidatus Komeilibacteria bacterium]